MKNIRIKSKKGFSLVEGTIAIAILGVLAVVGTVVIQNVIQNARMKAGHEIASELTTLARGYIDQGGDTTALDLTDFPSAYSDLSAGLTVEGVTYQYIAPPGKTPNTGLFAVPTNGIFAFTGDGSASPWSDL